MERQDAAMTILQDHVIVAVFAETDSPLIGLRNLVMPIRASNIHYKDLIHVVIVGNVDYLKSKFEKYIISFSFFLICNNILQPLYYKTRSFKYIAMYLNDRYA